MKNDRRLRRIGVLQRQIQRLDRRLKLLGGQSDRMTRWRLFSFILVFIAGGALLLTWGALAWAIGSIILLIPFILTVRWHRQVEDTIARHTQMVVLKKSHLARLTLDWNHIPPDQPINLEKDHPFAFDLDLIGDRSLARLIDLSITEEGGERFRQWLLETEPDPDRTLQRQTLVQELIRIPAFSDRLILNALLSGAYEQTASHNDGLGKWSGRRLVDWLDSRIEMGDLRKVFIILILLVPVNLALLGAFLFWDLQPFWIASWFVYGAVLISQSRQVEPMFRDAAFIHDSLRQLTAVFDTIENRSFRNEPGLLALLKPLRVGEQRPSVQLHRANRLLAAVGLRINPVMAILLNVFFPWDIYIGYRMEIFKRDLVDCLPEWLDLWYELEALSSLANFAYLHPGTPFAKMLAPAEFRQGSANGDTVRETAVKPFSATNLGHPLIPPDDCIGNDFTVDHLGVMTIITGSNMAGKSSFLRTVGVNIRLALAGAPVLADKLELMPFRVAASITVTDSVTDGFSFFYAEVRRLKALLEELNRPNPYPLFFLIDEIFRGTNNRERLIGSRSYVKALIGKYGTGAIATHDLELVNLASDNYSIRNAHFRDHVQGERMIFDYKLHDGPCPTTNALRIMELAGLPVDQKQWQDES